MLGFDYPNHVRFKCERCGVCCGDAKDRVRAILLMTTEARRISEKTKKSISDFAERIEGSEPYAYRMKKTADGKCLFLGKGKCTIYEIRPLICRFYPFELNPSKDRCVFTYTDECPFIGKGPELKRACFKELFSKFLEVTDEDTKYRHGKDFISDVRLFQR